MKSTYKHFRLRPDDDSKAEIPADYFVRKSAEYIRKKTIRIKLSEVKSSTELSLLLRVRRKGSPFPTIYRIEFHY